MMIRSIALLALAAALAGCASVDAQRAALASGSPCCATIALSRAVRLLAPAVAVEVPEDIAPVAFETGNSHYAVIDLGVTERPGRYLGIRQALAWTNV